jgi:hypothetical protein
LFTEMHVGNASPAQRETKKSHIDHCQLLWM